MVRRFVFGEPMNTGAVVADIPAETEHFSLMDLLEGEDHLLLSWCGE